MNRNMEMKPVSDANSRGSGPGKQKRVKEKPKPVTFSWPESFATRVKQAAAQRGMSVTAFVRSEITPAVDEALNELVEERLKERRPSSQ